jgi:hypothetical protein
MNVVWILGPLLCLGCMGAMLFMMRGHLRGQARDRGDDGR